MNLPGGGSPYPRYFPGMPPRPPDLITCPPSAPMVEVKGEYIEDCEDIKEESRSTPAPPPPPPPPPATIAPYSASLLTVSSPYLPQLRHIHHHHQPPPGLPHVMRPIMPPLHPRTMTQTLSPLELIQKLSNYAANNRKRMSTMQSEDTSSPSAKRFQQHSPTFHPPRIDQVISLQQQQRKVSPTKPKETNNNASDKRDFVSADEHSKDTEVPDLTQSSKSMIDCPVCGDIAVAHFHYGGMCCYSCKAFFRRVVNTNKATKYKCRAGNNQCDVSLANRRSCQACRYKKCVGAGMKPGLVLSDDQCNKKFGSKKGSKDDKTKSSASKHEEDADDPEEAGQEEHDEMADEDYSVLIDPSKSLSEQNRLGRQLFVSIFSTGSVSSGLMSDKELENFTNIDNNNSIASSYLIERAVRNSRKFLSFFQDQRGVFMHNGNINFSDITQTLIEQTVLVLKQNQDFKSLTCKDQTELLESNAMVVSLLLSMELYNAHTHALSWTLTETDYQALRKLNLKTVNGRAIIGLADVQPKIESDLRDDMAKLYKFFDYFSAIGVPKNALFVLAVVVVFCHDCCDIENKATIEEMRRRYLIILFECVSQSEGVLGACKIALKLHTAIHHLNRICQLFAQKFVTVKE